MYICIHVYVYVCIHMFVLSCDMVSTVPFQDQGGARAHMCLNTHCAHVTCTCARRRAHMHTCTLVHVHPCMLHAHTVVCALHTVHAGKDRASWLHLAVAGHYYCFVFWHVLQDVLLDRQVAVGHHQVAIRCPDPVIMGQISHQGWQLGPRGRQLRVTVRFVENWDEVIIVKLRVFVLVGKGLQHELQV